MAKKKSTSVKKRVSTISNYIEVLTSVSGLITEARRLSARAVNTVLTATYWEIGRVMVEYEQKGKLRARYGDRLLEKLSEDLTKTFGKGFSLRNLRNARSFYVGWPIRQTVSAEFAHL